jgi:PAS domain S-box-containing protein
MVAVVRDITERKRLEARFRRLVDSNAQGVFFWNTKGEIIGANDAFLQLVRYTREDLEAGRLNWAKMTPPEFEHLDRQASNELTSKGVCASYEKEFMLKDGSRVPILLGAAMFQDNSDEGVCFVLDLTERKKLEQQFLRAQRMESIGTLAGGIAHDLNNVLAPITMSIDLLKMRFTDKSSQELLATLGSSAQRGAEMVRQVLSFARGVEGRKMEVQVKHLLKDIEKIANDTFPKNIQVRSIIPNDLWTILGDPTQLHQVLLNLCVNARDAMPNGGTLTIAAENVHLDEHYAAMSPEAHPGAYSVLQITDTGTGMPPAIIEKIFDPFFTTKEIGKGTGLGLSTSLAIVKSHGGFIRVYSEPGKGTTFKAYFPGQTEFSAETEAEIAAELPRGNGELILIVDDEANVRQITRQTLEAFGYRVVTASDGAEAVAIVARPDMEISVVLTDMMMPVMDGPATIQVLLRLKPNLPIIAASGLSADGRVTQAASLGVKHFLSKPYSADALLQVLREILSGK